MNSIVKGNLDINFVGFTNEITTKNLEIANEWQKVLQNK